MAMTGQDSAPPSPPEAKDPTLMRIAIVMLDVYIFEAAAAAEEET